MGKRIDQTEREGSPGPGAYNVKDELVKPRSIQAPIAPSG